MVAREAFQKLFPGKDASKYRLDVKYTDRFKPYNANVRYTKDSFTFNLSKKWKGVSKEIQMGLIQGLLLRIFKERKSTINIDLYNSFMKNLHIAAPKDKMDPFLEECFEKVNEEYFEGLLEKTNLVWHNSLNRLGTYEFGSDTISISRFLAEDREVLEYVLYHEMLHKHLKFSCTNGRSNHHTKEFRDMEKKFRNSKEMEGRISKLIRKNKRKRVLGLKIPYRDFQ